MAIRYGAAAILLAVMLAGAAQAQTKKTAQDQPPQAPGTTDATGWTAPAATPPVDNRPVAQPGPVVVPPAVPPKTSFPTWSEFPVPVEVPGVTDIAQRVKAATDSRRTLAAEVKSLVWDKEQAEPFAAQTRARMDPQYATPIDPVQVQQQVEAILRNHFTPPPPVN